MRYARFLLLGLLVVGVLALPLWPGGGEQQWARAYPGLDGKIAFMTSRDDPDPVDCPPCNFEIYTINADGTAETRITSNTAEDVYPAWSPDGAHIAFTSDRDDPLGEVYVTDADGGVVTRLTNDPGGIDLSPAWSPDGTKIAFESNRESTYGEKDIYVMNADGSGLMRLTNTTTGDTLHPAWSPDGAKIAFDSIRDGNAYDIYMINADGSGETRVTDNAASDTFPAWSPDGSKIAFTSDRDGNREIYVMNADGSGQLRLTDNAAVDMSADWQRLPNSCPPTPWPTPTGDGDCDGFSDTQEAFVGTDAADACPDDLDDDAWPADLADLFGYGAGHHDGVTDIFDIVELTPPYFGKCDPDPLYTVRKDFSGLTEYVPDGCIDIFDITMLTPPMFNTSCTP